MYREIKAFVCVLCEIFITFCLLFLGEQLGYGLGGNLGNSQLPNHMVDRVKSLKVIVETLNSLLNFSSKQE